MEFYQTSDLHIDINKLARPAFMGLGLSRIREKYDNVVIIDWSHCDPTIPLVVVGDTANTAEYTILTILEAAKYFVKVYFTLGNHDYYGNGRRKSRTVGMIEKMVREYFKDNPKVVFLESHRPHREGSTLILGCPGWYTFDYLLGRNSEFALWKKDMNDPKCIRFDAMPDRVARYEMGNLSRHVSWAQDQDDIEEILVFTHTIPHRDFVYPMDHRKSSLNGSYFNSAASMVWEADTKGKIVHWGFGHTHLWFDRVKSHASGDIRFLSCGRGYHNEVSALDQFPVRVDSRETFKSAFEL